MLLIAFRAWLADQRLRVLGSNRAFENKPLNSLALTQRQRAVAGVLCNVVLAHEGHARM